MSDAVWHAIPTDVRAPVLQDASTGVRTGEPQRRAFWSAVRRLLEQDLFDDFQVERTYGEFAWPLIVANSEDDLNRVTEALLKAKATEHWDTPVSSMTPDEFWMSLEVPVPQLTCVYCGSPLWYGDVEEGEIALHSSCADGMSHLKRTVFEMVVGETEPETFSDGDQTAPCGADAGSPNSVTSMAEPPAPPAVDGELDVEALLDLFPGGPVARPSGSEPDL
ncbi:hypothetical protein [Salipiger mucosus]|uniref:hypothetical protein n=1 Tax=Salipiger mucosus TaxID=263378 RepID=UPI0012EBE9CC|nr:hypothetical protein [Salipiger mucosus]